MSPVLSILQRGSKMVSMRKMGKFSWVFAGIVAALLLLSSPAKAWKADFTRQLKNGGILVQKQNGDVLLEHRSGDAFIPASTMKVATAACALKVFGPDARFTTDFFVTGDGRLAVKGSGDPGLVSEELLIIAQNLKAQGLKAVKGLILDDSDFASNIVIDGQGDSGRAYDAVNGALVANYNTINVKKLKNGQVVSNEPQTPLTPLVLARMKSAKAGAYRTNLGGAKNVASRYFGELLLEFLKQQDVSVTGELSFREVPAEAALFYRHESSKTLAEVLRGMLEYSTNFTANQIFLMMGAKQYGAPATVAKSIDVMTAFLRDDVGLRDFAVFEGAGLSRQNHFSPREMVKLLDYFYPHRDLLNFKDGVFHAKTGTLNGVNTYAGYVDLPNGEVARFALFVNDQVPFDHKFTMARQLYRGITGRDVPKQDNGHGMADAGGN